MLTVEKDKIEIKTLPKGYALGYCDINSKNEFGALEKDFEKMRFIRNRRKSIHV